MPKKLITSKTPQKVNTATADVVLGGGGFLLFMGGNSVPTPASDWLFIDKIAVIPKGVGAYVLSPGPDMYVTAMVYDQASAAPTNPWA